MEARELSVQADERDTAAGCWFVADEKRMSVGVLGSLVSLSLFGNTSCRNWSGVGLCRRGISIPFKFSIANFFNRFEKGKI